MLCSMLYKVLHKMLYNILYNTLCNILCNLLYSMIYTMLTPILNLSQQVAVLEAKLKGKICPYTYFKAKGFEAFSKVPCKELHQLLLGVMGYYIIPGSNHWRLCRPLLRHVHQQTRRKTSHWWSNSNSTAYSALCAAGLGCSRGKSAICYVT